MTGSMEGALMGHGIDSSLMQEGTHNGSTKSPWYRLMNEPDPADIPDGGYEHINPPPTTSTNEDAKRAKHDGSHWPW